MAEPKPVDAKSEARSPEEAPKLVAVTEGATRSGSAAPSVPTRETSPAEPERKVVSRTLFLAVAGLLVLSLLGLYAQTQHARAQSDQIALLGNQIEGLEVQLSAANTQIATYDMQLTLVQDSVRDMYEKMGSLLDLVSVGPGLGEMETPAPEANEGGALELR